MSNVTGFDFDLKSVCRICFTKVSDYRDLFSKSDESIEILKKMSMCFQVILNPERYLPCAICMKCIEELDNANSFRIKCVTINERFKQYWDNLMKNTANKIVPGTSIEFSEDSQTDNADSECNENLQNKDADKDPSFKCEMCCKTLKSKKSLQRHMVCMHKKQRYIGRVSGFGSARRYHCTSCSYSTPHSQTLVNHMRRHNGERPFSCECGKNFTQASSLSAHRKTHSPTSYFTCSHCGKQFKHAYSLKTHLRVHDSGKFICSVCTKVLKSKETLQAHMKRHYKVYNYNCEDCGDTFVTSAELHNHRLKHNTVKKIKCHLCDYMTHTKKSLVLHLKRHVGDRAFKCNFCEKAFYTQGDLRRHMRVHTREKPFSCQTCAQRFTYSTSLNKHMQTVHGIQYKWSDVKWKEARIKKHQIKPA